MTWAMENKDSTPENRVAVINLKVCSRYSQQQKAGGGVLIKFKIGLDTCALLEKFLALN